MFGNGINNLLRDNPENWNFKSNRIFQARFLCQNPTAVIKQWFLGWDQNKYHPIYVQAVLRINVKNNNISDLEYLMFIWENLPDIREQVDDIESW